MFYKISSVFTFSDQTPPKLIVPFTEVDNAFHPFRVVKIRIISALGSIWPTYTAPEIASFEPRFETIIIVFVAVVFIAINFVLIPQNH